MFNTAARAAGPLALRGVELTLGPTGPSGSLRNVRRDEIGDPKGSLGLEGPHASPLHPFHDKKVSAAQRMSRARDERLILERSCRNSSVDPRQGNHRRPQFDSSTRNRCYRDRETSLIYLSISCLAHKSETRRNLSLAELRPFSLGGRDHGVSRSEGASPTFPSERHDT